MRISTTQLCSKALIHIEVSKRSKYNQAQFINYAMLCRATRICFTNHVQNHNTLQRLKVIFVKLTTAVTIEETVNLQCKHATLVNNYRSRLCLFVRQSLFLFLFSFFFFLFRYYSFICFMTIYYTHATFWDIHRLSRQDRKTNGHESRREHDPNMKACLKAKSAPNSVLSYTV